jgi:hypothetical protein
MSRWSLGLRGRIVVEGRPDELLESSSCREEVSSKKRRCEGWRTKVYNQCEESEHHEGGR